MSWVVIPIVRAARLRQTGKMPASDLVLLPLCIGIALIGVLIAGLAWRKGERGRVVQGAALAVAPVGLYFTGLLRLLWDAVVALVGWATGIIFSPTMWFGISLLGLCVVLWVVGGILTRRSAARGGSTRGGTARGGTSVSVSSSKPAVAGARPVSASPSAAVPAKKPGKGKAAAADIDPELAEIEAILKNRGIN